MLECRYQSCGTIGISKLIYEEGECKLTSCRTVRTPIQTIGITRNIQPRIKFHVISSHDVAFNGPVASVKHDFSSSACR